MIDIENHPQLMEKIQSLPKEEKREVLRKLAKEDLFFLSEYILRNRDSEPAPLNREYHGEVCDWLQRGFLGKEKNESFSARKLLLAPRGTLKSTVACRALAIFLIINDPNITILLTSATNDNAQKKLRAIAEVFERNVFFKWLFPELIPGNFRDNWTNSKILVPRDATDPELTVECQSAESELTSRHYDYIIDDDIVGKENSETADQILKVKNFYTQSLQLLKKPHGRRLVIGTLWNFSDLYNHILENMYDSYDILVRSIYKNDRYVRNEDGTFRWEVDDNKASVYPELISTPEVQELKGEVTADPNQGISTWKAQYELKIVDEETAVFPQSKSREEAFWFTIEDLYDKKLAFSLSLDPAVSESRRADETAFTVRAIDEYGVWYLVDGYASQGMGEQEVVDKYIEFLEKYPIDLCTIETIHFQRYLKQALEKECRKRGLFFPFMQLPPSHSQASKKDSDLKIRGLAPYYATNKLKFLKNDNFTEGLLFQLWKFPKTAKDDRVDSLSMHNHLPLVPSKIWKESGNLPREKKIKVDRYGYRIKAKPFRSKYL